MHHQAQCITGGEPDVDQMLICENGDRWRLSTLSFIGIAGYKTNKRNLMLKACGACSPLREGDLLRVVSGGPDAIG